MKKNNIFPMLAGLAILCVLSACTPAMKMRSELPVYLDKSPAFEHHFTGFALFDPARDKMIYARNADKYFTPASNVKLLTFYTSWKLLSDFMPAIQYVEQGDSLIFWGAGNPAFLHPYIADDGALFNFLKRAPGQLFFCPNNFLDTHFGPGWAWEDYDAYFQPERSSLPIYGNVVLAARDSLREGFDVQPPFFKNYMEFDAGLGGDRAEIVRDECANRFRYNARAMTGESYLKEIPFKYSDALLVALLSDTLGREVTLLDLPVLPDDFPESRELGGGNMFETYRFLLQHSDNFIAEQLLLMCSARLFDTLQVSRTIAYAKDRFFRDLPDEPVWVDGSGLSRYNLLTPRSVVRVLEKMYKEIPEEQLFALLPAGGVSGTIEHWYEGENGPYVFAKTGTLSGNHCLSGYLKTKSGKTLIFSFMNNHYRGSSAPVKREMERILKKIYEAY